MRDHRQRGATLAFGLVLLTLVAVLGLAGSGGAHVERRLAQNNAFRENAASAASAGIEMAIRAITMSSTPANVPALLSGELGASGRFEVRVEFIGHESALPQLPDARLAGAHFEITSTGQAAAWKDRQRAQVLRVFDTADDTGASDCEPVMAISCYSRDQVERISWQRVPAE